MMVFTFLEASNACSTGIRRFLIITLHTGTHSLHPLIHSVSHIQNTTGVHTLFLHLF